MRRIIIVIALTLCFFGAFAQEKDTVSTDTVKKGKKVTIEVSIGGDKSDTVKSKKKPTKFFTGITFARIDLGVSRYLDQGSFTLSPQNSFLEFESAKTHNFGFEFFQIGYRFNSNFKIYVGAGLDWNHIRLHRNITFLKDQPTLTYKNDSVDYKKNRFSSQYLRIPLSFQFRTNDDQRGNKFYFVAGPEIGFLMGSKQKQVSKEREKEKFKDDFNFEPFRYGAFARLGYANMGMYVKYYFNDVFAQNQGPKDFKNLSLGLTIGF